MRSPHGLVPSNTLNMTKQDLDGFFTVDGRVLEGINQFSSLYFSETDLSVMEEVWKDFGGMSSIQLRGLSHLFPEWKRFEKELADPDLPNSYPINDEDLFKPPIKEVPPYKFDKNQSQESKEVYLSHQSFQNFLCE